jgi:hypothetical protein
MILKASRRRRAAGVTSTDISASATGAWPNGEASPRPWSPWPARSILVIVWHLLAEPAARFHDLGADRHVRQLQALGFTVTPHPAA